VLNVDQDFGSYISAVDRATGKAVWKTDRPGFPRGFSTPAVWRHDGIALNVNALPITLPLVTLGWIGLFVLLGRLSTRFSFPNWAEVLLPWVAAIAALTAMANFWHSHHIAPHNDARRQKRLATLSRHLKKLYHPTRPIATTMPGLLQRATGRPVAPIDIHSIQPTKQPAATRGKAPRWTLQGQPGTVITSLWQSHEWNDRPLPSQPHPAEQRLLELLRTKQLSGYQVKSLKLSKKLYWIVLQKTP